MGRIKPRGRYMAISVPIALYDEIEKHVSQFSYNSIAEFVKESIRFNIRYEKSTMNKGPIFGTSGIEPKPFGTNEHKPVFPYTDEAKKYFKAEIKEILEKTLKEQKKKKTETNGNGHGLV